MAPHSSTLAWKIPWMEESSCLENPRDGGAWWAAIYGVAQSRTRLKRLSSSSSSDSYEAHWSQTAWVLNLSAFQFPPYKLETVVPHKVIVKVKSCINDIAEALHRVSGILLLLLLSCFSRVRLLATPWTAAHQAPPSMGCSRHEYWSGVPLPYCKCSKNVLKSRR